MCVCMYVCMHVCMFMGLSMCVCMYAYLCVYVCMHLCMNVCMNAYLCVYVCIYVCMYMYAFMYVYVCTLIYVYTKCGRKVMRLATLCTNRQRCCLPLHMAVRLTPAVDSVQVWTCCNCYAIVESVWSEVVFVRRVTKMDRQKFEQRCAIKFCVKLGESATVTYEKLQRAYGERSLSRA